MYQTGRKKLLYRIKKDCINKGFQHCPYTDSGFMNYHFLYSSGQVDIRGHVFIKYCINFAILALCSAVIYLFACAYVHSSVGMILCRYTRVLS
jgi:hypothetical protein